MSAPDWADSMVDLVMVHEGIARPPAVVWMRGPLPGDESSRWSMHSAGAAIGDSILVDAGIDERDARHTLLHELAHWVTGTGHHSAMYSKMYELIWLFGEPGDLEYAREREAEYQPEASASGWDRFRSRIKAWASRLDDYVELLVGVGSLSVFIVAL